MSYPRNIGAALALKFGAVSYAVAGGAGDNTEVDGPSIDREDAHSAAVLIEAQAALDASETLILKATIQDSADGSSWADVAAAHQPEGAANSTILTLTGGGGGTTERGTYKHELNLSSLRRYIRVQILPNLSRANTDTAICAATVALGGLTIET